MFAPGVVQTVFSAFNVALLPPWFLMIFAPNTDFTKATIRSGAPMALFAAFYAYLFVAATAQNAAAGSDLLEDVAYLFTEATAGAPRALRCCYTVLACKPLNPRDERGTADSLGTSRTAATHH